MFARLIDVLSARLRLFRNHANLSELTRRYFWTTLVVTALALITGVLEGLGVGLLIPLLSIFSNSPAAAGGVLGIIAHFAQGHSRNGRLLIVTSVILACVLLKSLFEVVENLFASWTDGRIGHEIRSVLAERLLDLGYVFFLEEDSTRLLNILSAESWKASEAARIVLTRLAEAATAAVFISMLFFVSWKLSVLVLAGGLLARYVQKRAEIRLRRWSQGTVRINQELADRMLFTVFGARLIRLFGSQQSEKSRFDQVSDVLRRANLKVEALSGILGPLLETMHGVLFLVVLIIAIFLGVSLPILAAFLVLMNRLQPHLRALEQSGAALASAAAHFGEVEWLLNRTGKPFSPAGTLPFAGLTQEIRFRDVTFGYRGRGEPAVQGVDLTLRRGRSTALIGGSGAGKTTLVALLCRLVEPSSGAIEVDGQPLAQLRIQDWLGNIAVAGQDVDLIDATIAENIAYNRPDLDRESIREAARAAGADFIDDLPLGLETVVGSQGLSLSGGQRQRVGIARALARKPQLLILDEATSAVDHHTESAVLSTLQRLPQGTTLLVISHRRSTLNLCDDAVVLERGRVVRTGTLASVSEYWGDHAVLADLGLVEEPALSTRTTSA